jgi:hypothetical protein
MSRSKTRDGRQRRKSRKLKAREGRTATKTSGMAGGKNRKNRNNLSERLTGKGSDGGGLEKLQESAGAGFQGRRGS